MPLYSHLGGGLCYLAAQDTEAQEEEERLLAQVHRACKTGSYSSLALSSPVPPPFPVCHPLLPKQLHGTESQPHFHSAAMAVETQRGCRMVLRSHSQGAGSTPPSCHPLCHPPSHSYCSCRLPFPKPKQGDRRGHLFVVKTCCRVSPGRHWLFFPAMQNSLPPVQGPGPRQTRSCHRSRVHRRQKNPWRVWQWKPQARG
jgi:hypothetical protein